MTRKSLDLFLKSHEIDIYCSTWNIQEKDILLDYSVFNIYNPYIKSVIVKDWELHNNSRQNIKKIDRENDVFKVNSRAIEHGDYWVNRLKDQWFLVKCGYELIKNPEKYDIIWRLRFDAECEEFNFIKTDNIVIPKSPGGWSYCDHMAYGNLKVMNKYCMMYDHIEKMYNIHNIDISHAEYMLQFYMEKYDFLINTTIDENIHYGLNGR